MVRRTFSGLRVRLLLGLLLTWGVTLAVVAVALLQPLERRLRDDARRTLTQDARAARVALRGLDASQLRPGAPDAAQAIHAIGRRADADAVLVDRSGAVLASTDTDAQIRLGDAQRAQRTGDVVARFVSAGATSDVQVSVPAGTEGGGVGLILVKRLDSVGSAVHVVRRAVLVAALIGLATALLLGAALARPLVRRLRGLRDMALRVARLGPHVEVAPDDAHDEVADLTRAFATMQDRLREQEQARRSFVSTASHELRTPVTSLRLMLDLLREEVEATPPAAPERVRDQLRDAAEQTARLGQLTDELLDLSRLDAGVPLSRELVDLRAASRAVAGELAPRARESERPLMRDERTAPLWAVADPRAVTQILRILLDNALRFGPVGKPIRVTVEERAGTCTVSVRDEGTGIAADEREAIFERFTRGRGASGTTGFGLGLAIGRELARRMDGDLILAAPDGGGARFELWLPPGPGA